jgi:hypothetical protein
MGGCGWLVNRFLKKTRARVFHISPSSIGTGRERICGAEKHTHIRLINCSSGRSDEEPERNKIEERKEEATVVEN